MKRVLGIGTVVFVALFVTAMPTFAFTSGFYSGTLDLSDASMDVRAGYDCSGTGGLVGMDVFYYETDTLIVPADGMFYGYVDFFDPTDVFVVLYPQGAFDPSNPAANCFATFDDEKEDVNVPAGSYTMVVTTFNEDESGGYRFALGYPGVATGDFFVSDGTMPARPNDNAASCDSLTPFAESGSYPYVYETNWTPVVSGPYTYYDLYQTQYIADIWLVIYQGAFNPEDPLANCIANFDNSGEIYLQAGVEYTLVATTYDPVIPGGGGGCGEGGCKLIAAKAEGIPYAFLFMYTGTVIADTSPQTCLNPLPAGAVIHSIPNGPATYWEPGLQYGTNFNLPAGEHWYVFGTSGDFSHVWIACRATPVWVLTSEVVP
ncbi:MAG: hypothetical protein U0670_07115 [Anaerolineae bacterium]